jgi:cation diffusion facilitator CzcD-associated flavoprotein CzcO
VKVDREWQGSSQILFDYLVVATGMLLTQPVAMEYDKLSSVENLKKHQSDVKRSKSILIVGVEPLAFRWPRI